MNPKQQSIGMIICEGAGDPSPINIIGEATNTGSSNRVMAEGVLQDVDKENRNRRIYERKDLFPQLNAKRTVELLKSGNLKGEAGHPMDKDLARQQTIDPTKVQVLYTKLWTEGNQIKAQFRGTNNALGQEFNDDLLAGELPSFSLRALGSIDNVNGKAYVRNIKIITWDRVYFPSHECAYTEKILSEGASIMVPSHVLSDEERRINENGMMFPITNQSVIDYIKQESANVLTAMNNFDVLYESMKLIDKGRNLQMVDRAGNVLIVNVESYVQDEIMDYCFRR